MPASFKGAPMTLPLIIEPQELEAALGQDNLLILDLGKADTYQQAHVPGAVSRTTSRYSTGH